MLGPSEGVEDSALVGLEDGEDNGEPLGEVVGISVGKAVSLSVGLDGPGLGGEVDGEIEGKLDGLFEGELDGDVLNKEDGASLVWEVGDLDRTSSGTLASSSLSLEVGFSGAVGLEVTSVVGDKVDTALGDELSVDSTFETLLGLWLKIWDGTLLTTILGFSLGRSLRSSLPVGEALGIELK